MRLSQAISRTLLYVSCISFPLMGIAGMSRSAGYATRLYWQHPRSSNVILTANPRKKSLEIFDRISRNPVLPCYERGYAKLYLGRELLESGKIVHAKEMLAKADDETDAFWGDELLLDYFRRHSFLKHDEAKGLELARKYAARRDDILKGVFDARRLHFFDIRSCIDCSLTHWYRYRSMYNSAENSGLRLSSCLDFCNSRIYELTKLYGQNDGKKSGLRFDRIPLPKQVVILERRWNPLTPFADTVIGRIEGEGEVWQECGRLDTKFSLRITTRLSPSAGTELTTRSIYHGRVLGDKAEFLSANGEPFESPYMTMSNGKLRLMVPYRTSRMKGIAYFFCGPGAETLHVETIVFTLPQDMVKKTLGE